MKTPQLKAAQQAAEAFAAEVAYWRENAGLGKKALAVKMGFDPSYVSHIEAGRHKPTEDFARKADAALNSGDAIWRRWRDFEAARAHGAGEHAAPLSPRLDPALAAAALVCEHDAAPWTTTEPCTGWECGGCCATPAPNRSPATSSASRSTATPASPTNPAPTTGNTP
ncbi:MULTISPECIES: helix-turn-helix domain-containing protein [Nocardia]|uniref:helix-turn-helix domain-containing protein n=1 Tax=Nocardia TaxID=1817 RepID=UPI000A6BEC51|nr:MULTISPECIES: helix-turn-helix transcriptional regulator [Nocardia]MCC3316700.1 helix-turn-helix transcriptional regulator [Nocardia africana]